MTVHRVGLRRFFAFGLVSALALVGAEPARAAAAASPPTGSVSVSIVSQTGAGCGSPGSTFLAPDNSGFVLDRVAQTQAGAAGQPTDVRAPCRTTVSITIPAGFSYAVAQVEYNGVADVASGATAALRGSFSFPAVSLPARAALTRTFTGPFQDSWHAVDTVASADLGFVPCGRSLTANLDTELRVTAGTSTPGRVSTLTLGNADPQPASIYRLTWRSCS